jgi:hypothetical protein
VKRLPKAQSGYPARDGNLYSDAIEYCVIEVREGYAAGDFDDDELELRAAAAVRGDVVAALPEHPFLPIQLETVWR